MAGMTRSPPMVPCDDKGIAGAADVIRGGGVVVFPTDTVYGIGCDPYNAAAVRRIYEIKSRDSAKPLPVLVDSVETAQGIAAMDYNAVNIARRFWPGPLTIILDVTDARLAVSLRLDSGGGAASGGIALRVPAHDCAKKLLGACKMVAGTSANASGAGHTGDPALCAASVPGCDMILDGGVIPDPEASTIIDARGGDISVARKGRITLDEIKNATVR